MSTTPTDYNTALFRRLSWEGTVPLEIRVDPKELPANSDRGLECYYIQAPRVSYLPLLMPEIRRFLMDVVFDDAAAKVLKEEDWWFESAEGILLKWHWPVGLIYDNHSISMSVRPSNPQFTPMRLVLHLASPPTEKLLASPSADACKLAFMGQLKEADFIRWGNTKRMTGLRKADQDGLWEGIRDHNFDNYWRVASKVTPTAGPTRSQSPVPSATISLHNRPPSADSTAPSERDGAYSVRSVPVRIYLPDGPVLQDLVPPLLEDGSPNTLARFLTAHIPLLFPPRSRPSTPSGDQHTAALYNPELAYALIQGVRSPPEAEMAWLGACMAGADGWLNHHDWFTALLTFGLCCGLVISYLPQHFRIINQGSSEGFSPWFLLLGSTSSAAGFLNMITMQWRIVRCCPVFSLSSCLEMTAGIIQLGLQWGMFNLIFVLYMMYYPPHLKYTAIPAPVNSGDLTKPRSSRDRSPEWRLSILLAWFVVIHMVFSTLTTFALLFTVPIPSSPSIPLPTVVDRWATFLGVSSALLAAIQYAPQIIHTYKAGIVGALSIPMMCIQSPGAVLMVLSIALRPGTNWTSWITFAVAGIMQSSLLIMCIVFHFKQKRLGLDEYGNPLPGTTAHEVTGDMITEETPLLDGSR
ncbi:hypothetical protein H0H92_008884 [Tricholoma furcatifolium]|nr:hypothetical protein H0H92_008884 [Tricholoma furcatifolium]